MIKINGRSVADTARDCVVSYQSVQNWLMPARVGTTGVAIACAGLEPVADMRAKTDLNGRPLKVTFQATADSLATIANLKMGESSESTPIVIVRDSGAAMTDRRIGCDEMAISHEQCVHVRSLRRDCVA